MDLSHYRDKIDSLDAEIVRLLNERTRAASEIGRLKEVDNASVYVPSREKDVLDRVARLNQGPLTEKNVRAIYREIMSASISLEADVTVAFLGPNSTFSHQAAVSRFGASVKYLPCDTIADVFRSVEAGDSQYGVVPIENSIQGAVTYTQDELGATELKICAEIYHRINHSLMAKPGTSTIKKIYSHPQALGQCRKWLEAYHPDAELHAVSSTAAAAQAATTEDGSAAIASSLAAEINGLEILDEKIQDISTNTTRFLVLNKSYGPATGHDKTSIHFGVKHEVGALVKILQIFEESSMNLSKIESRPDKSKQWEYFFFVDFEGHASDEVAQKALAQVSKHCMVMEVLGSFPKGARVEG